MCRLIHGRVFGLVVEDPVPADLVVLFIDHKIGDARLNEIFPSRNAGRSRPDDTNSYVLCAIHVASDEVKCVGFTFRFYRNCGLFFYPQMAPIFADFLLKNIQSVDYFNCFS